MSDLNLQKSTSIPVGELEIACDFARLAVANSGVTDISVDALNLSTNVEVYKQLSDWRVLWCVAASSPSHSAFIFSNISYCQY